MLVLGVTRHSRDKRKRPKLQCKRLVGISQAVAMQQMKEKSAEEELVEGWRCLPSQR